MRLPIDTGTVKFAAAGSAEPVLDYETRAPKLDENGAALFNVPLLTPVSRGYQKISVVYVTPDSPEKIAQIRKE